MTTTTHHPFWDVTTHTWTQAASLHPGDTLQTPTGHAQVVALRLYTATHTTYDLTIHHLHTYYVKAGTTPLLVHNCGSEISIDDLAEHRPGHELDPQRLSEMRELPDEDLLNAARNPSGGDNITVSDDGRIVDGNHRAAELIRRAGDPESTITGDMRVPVDTYKRDLSMFWDLD